MLTASLRLQTSERLPASAGPEGRKPAGAGPARKGDGVTAEERDRERESGGVSSERAFADYVFGSLILHGFCVNFIN